MELKVKRTTFTNNSVIGELSVNGIFNCYTLEDRDRDLYDTMPLNEIITKKIYAATAIPYGKYSLTLSYSNRFKTYLPLVNNVKGFEGIRIHKGNASTDTEGCLLVGRIKKIDSIRESKLAFDALMKILKKTEKLESITIEYHK